MNDQDITFIIKAKNDARKAAKQFSDDMEAAGTSIEEVEAAAGEASKATDELGGEAKKSALAFNLLSAAVVKLTSIVATLGASVASAALGSLVPIALLGRLTTTIALVGILAGALVGLGIIGKLANDAREFVAALSEVSTLIEGTPRQLDELTQAANDLVVSFGGSRAAQLQGFYQAISAGIGGVTEATELLDVANRLAIGGVTDVTTAVDILTTAVNSYGPDVITAAEASDALFVAMRAGKTTIGELGQNLGQVIPIAQAAGVSFDELAAAVSTITTRGITTNIATTQLRALIQAIVVPSDEAKKAALQYSIAFDETALASKGLQGVLQELAEVTGGSLEELSRFIPSVEGIQGALALTSGGGAKFSQILADMREKAGATEEAFNKMSGNLDQRMKVALSTIVLSMERLGAVLLTVVVPVMEALAFVLNTVANNFDVIAVAAGVLALRSLPALIGGAQLLIGVLLRLTGVLGLMRGLFGSTAAGAGILSIALRALPLLGAIAAVVALGRALSATRSNFAEFNEDILITGAAVTDLIAILDGIDGRVTTATLAVTQEATQRSLDNLIQTKAQVEAALQDLTAVGGRVLFPGKVAGLEDALATVNARINETVDNLGILSAAEARFSTATGSAEQAAIALATAVREVGSTQIQAVPSIAELRAQYGSLAETIRDNIIAQNELAIVNGQLEFENTLSSFIALANQMDLTEAEMTALNDEVARIKTIDGIGDQARAAAELADRIQDAAGEVSDLTDEERAAVEELRKAVAQAGALVANANAAAGAISSASGAAAGLVGNLAAAAAQAAQVASNIVGAQNAAARAARASLNAAPDPVSQAGARAVNDFREGLDDGGYALIAGGRADALASAESAVRTSAEETAALQEEAAGAIATYNELQSTVTGSGTSSSGATSGGSSPAATAREEVSALDQAVRTATEGYQQQIDTLGLTRAELEEYEIRQRLLQAAQRDGVELSEEVVQSVLAQRDAFEAAAAAADTFAVGYRLAFDDFKDQVQTTAEFSRDFFTSVFESIGEAVSGTFSAIGSLISSKLDDGKADFESFRDTIRDLFKGLLKGLLEQILQFFANRLVIDLLGVNGNFGGGTGGMGTVDFLSGIFGGLAGARAEGGPVIAGRDYLVGETGPEIFRAPSSGYIQNNQDSMAALEGNSGRTINMAFNISTPDAASFQRSQGQIEARMAASLNRADQRNN